MRKKQINEEQLLVQAQQWFEQIYGKSPREHGINFIKIWYKPSAFATKTIAVVFAPSEEIGKAFMWEQNAIFHTLGNFWIVGIFLAVFMFTFLKALASGDESSATAIAVVFGSLCLCGILFFEYMYKKCKKLEKIHQWNVVVYYP